ncbi:MAG: hypothetical protein JW750_08960 [Anaerolineaceae bacterium]|nr:hypothetical protein [Anaerolineaceae bacterium]
MAEQDCIQIVLFGPGKVGRALLEQLLNCKHPLKKRCKIIAVADSQGMLLDMDGLDGGRINEALRAKRKGHPLGSLEGCFCLDLLPQTFGKNTILVDATASDTIHETLRAGLENGCSVVMANKKNLTHRWEISKPFFSSTRVRYEGTVCSGMPVVASLQRLIDSGEEITHIEGSLSGTLSFLCSQFDEGSSYEEAVATAHMLGYTEPDPRDDLSGMDVARKALILARTAGWALEMTDLQVEHLYSEQLAAMSPEEFMRHTYTQNDIYAKLVSEAAQQHQVLRYIATVDETGGKVRLMSVDQQSDFGALTGPGNRVAFLSTHFSPIPLALTGPGAGVGLTASGILADIIDISQRI